MKLAPPDLRLLSRRLVCALFVIALLGGGCMNSKESGNDQGEQDERSTSRENLDLGLARSSDAVRTVQLYKGTDETALPVVELESGDRLTLEFDLIRSEGRPLTVYFYHANQQWTRDLSPIEYLQSYERDDLMNYTSSRSTEVPYVHYEYTFPNNDIGFQLSGNYVLRVTEQGNENKVLFERAFFVSENAISPEFLLDRRVISGAVGPMLRPILRFVPPSSLDNTNVFDYNTCFVQDGRFERARCSDRPRALEGEGLRFDLDPRRAFREGHARYVLDLSDLEPSGQIASLNRGARPPTVTLEPDYVRFPDVSGQLQLNSQTRIAGAIRALDEPDVTASYVEATFRFVPPKERPLSHPVYLTGSFNGWQQSTDSQLEWNAAENRYEGTLLLKQGQYEYRYTSEDPDLRRALLQNLPPRDSRFTALVYYRDVHRSTDRLLAVQQVDVR